MMDPLKNFRDSRVLIPTVLVGTIAVFLRLLNLGTQGMFLDETFSWLHSQFPISDLLGILTHLNHTPLYFFLLKFYLIFVPQTEFGLRSLSVIFSLFSFLVAIIIMYRWWGNRAALFAGWLIAISSFEIYYAQDVRMYTMLSFLWLVSFGLLLEILIGRPKLLLFWSISLVLISQTHIYGLILAFAQSALIAVLWVSGKYLRKRGASSGLGVSFPPAWTWAEISVKISGYSKWVLVSGLIIAFGVLPIILSLLRSTAWRSLGGGVWIPSLKDLPMLYLLASVGLTAGRSHFLDSSHLVLPELSKIPTWLWMFVGILLPGLLAIKGSIQSWKIGAKQRWFVGILFISTIAPIMLVWLLGWILQINTWAYKPFLGVLLLFYLLAGIGFSTVTMKWVRWVLVVLTFGVALASLIPYYTIWNKDNSKDAFGALPNVAADGVVLMDRAYMSPLAHFYLGTDVHVLGLKFVEDFEYPFLDAEFGPKFMYGYDELACEGLDFQNVWIYGNENIVRERLLALPGCFGDADLWIFNNGNWEPFDL